MRAADGKVLFGEWLPDLSSLDNPGLTEAKNVRPIDGDYKPYFPISGVGDAMAARPRGAIAALDASGAAFLYAGTATKLYVKDGTAWTDKSGATTFTLATDDYWRFAQFDTSVIGTNYADVPVSIASGGAGNFATLAASGTAPRARQIGVIGRFVVLGDTNDATNGIVPHRLQWSAIDDETNWPTPGTAGARTVQSGEQFMNAAFGAVTSIIGGDQIGIVLQRSAVSRMSYVAGDVVFQFDTIDRSRGARFPNATVQVGSVAYFIAADGFFATDGVNVIPIGDGKFDRHFFDSVDTAYIGRVYGAVDKINGLIYWIYPGPSNSAGRPNRVLIYNYAEKRGSRAEDEIELVVTGLTSATTLDGLDALFSSIDAVTPSLDSAVWQGGNDVLLGFDQSFKVGNFSGTPGTAVIDSQEVEFFPGLYARISGIKALVSGSSPALTVALGTRDDLGASVAYTDPVSPTTRTGFADFRTEARYARSRVSISGAFDYAKGMEYQINQSGAT